MQWIKRDIRKNALLAAPAFALALAACGGGASDVASEAPSAPAEIVEDATTSAPAVESEVAESSTDDAGEAAESTASSSAAPASSNTIQRLSADEAIANAEVNQPNLASANNVLDIETLAVADGSIQTLRDVVDGDRPVLLWFFSPH